MEAKNLAAVQLPVTSEADYKPPQWPPFALRAVRRSWRPDDLGLTMSTEASEADDERKEWGSRSSGGRVPPRAKLCDSVSLQR